MIDLGFLLCIYTQKKFSNTLKFTSEIKFIFQANMCLKNRLEKECGLLVEALKSKVQILNESKKGQIIVN